MDLQLRHVPIAALPPDRFRDVLDDHEYQGLVELIARAARLLHGRSVWCLNSTSRGGGVAEMLASLLAYTRGAGIDTRWVVIDAPPEFFRLTKRIHNRLHGHDGDGGPLGAEERELYEHVLAANAGALLRDVVRGDVVILHDPQTAGMAGVLRESGVHVAWRCHVGADRPNDLVREAWDFLRPYVLGAEVAVFSREQFVWEGLESERPAIIPPSIDAFSAKNQSLSPESVAAILAVAGLQADGDRGAATFTREDGSPGRVDRKATVLQDGALRAGDRVITQVSRWDRLKDPVGVLRGFAEHAAPRCDAHLVLAGPSAESVSDDPEGAGVLEEVTAAWRGLPGGVRARVHVASLPMDDLEENAAIVNAVQRRSTVVVQKSLAEGFGLTVAEAMWKGRPVVASAVGGIKDQVIDGETGILLDDPADLAAYGDALCRLVDDADTAERMGTAARERVREHFLAPRHLGQWVDVVAGLLGDEAARAAGPGPG